MGRLSTHVLDTVAGKPASGIRWSLYQCDGDDQRRKLGSGVTNSDGRTDAPLLEGDALKEATYEIVFEVADYFTSINGPSDTAPFLDVVPLRFTVFDASQNYHVPLLVSPFSYSTYRGS